MYAAILTSLIVIGGSQGLGGGTSVEVVKVDTHEQCRAIVEQYKMQAYTRELYNKFGRTSYLHEYKGECVMLPEPHKVGE